LPLLLLCHTPALPASPLLSCPYRAPHRHLHSFPTRRSSDLPSESRRRAGADCSPRRATPSLGCLNHDLIVSLRIRTEPRPVLRTDRKSTRLNSSHVSISYAVFCLKKKRTTQARSRRRDDALR